MGTRHAFSIQRHHITLLVSILVYGLALGLVARLAHISRQKLQSPVRLGLISENNTRTRFPIKMAIYHSITEQSSLQDAAAIEQETPLMFIQRTHPTEVDKTTQEIISIDSVTRIPNTSKWNLYINNVLSTHIAHTYILKPQDTVEWKLETYE